MYIWSRLKRVFEYQYNKKVAIHPYRVVVTVVELFISEQQRVSDEDEDGSQDEGDKQLDVNVVPCAVQLSEEILTFTVYCIILQFSGQFQQGFHVHL